MELRTYISPLLKWWWLVVLATVLAGISSFFAVRQQPPTCQSRITLMVGRTIEELNPSSYYYHQANNTQNATITIRRAII